MLSVVRIIAVISRRALPVDGEIQRLNGDEATEPKVRLHTPPLLSRERVRQRLQNAPSLAALLAVVRCQRRVMLAASGAAGRCGYRPRETARNKWKARARVPTSSPWQSVEEAS